PDAHHRDSGDPSGRVHRKADEGAGNLKTVTFFLTRWRRSPPERGSSHTLRTGCVVFSGKCSREAQSASFQALRASYEEMIATLFLRSCLEHRGSNEVSRARKQKRLLR